MHAGFKRALAVAGTALALGGAGLGVAGTANAAPITSAHAVTHVTNRPDSGNGGTWAYDNFNRTLDIKVAASQAGVGAGNTRYTATVVDKGSFSAVQGALTPNQAVAGAKVAHAVKGEFAGGIAYTVIAPTTDTLTGTVPAAENDHFTGPAVTTGNWAKQAFASQALVTVSGGTNWAWSYSTACERWTDSSVNADGNLAADGNITGKLCVSPARPYVYDGKVLTLAGTDATVGWKDSIAGWPHRADGKKCAVVQEFGPGFTSPLGEAHTGFTCDTTGYLTGMHIGHGYSLFVWPAAAGDSYAGSHAVVPGSPNAHIYLVATAA
jgi:hypothetical protein